MQYINKHHISYAFQVPIQLFVVIAREIYTRTHAVYEKCLGVER